jgi:succinate dehydrogenase/fumarate reductase cytochrome b subunit (b558 family)
VVHLFINARALNGREKFETTATDLSAIPYLLILEIAGIWLPLAFHAAYGLALSFEARPNVGKYPFSRNWAYTLQRLTGIVALAFIAYHLWQFRIQVLLGRANPEDLFPELCRKLSSTTPGGIPLMALLYLVGVAAAVFHFTNGLYGFCFSWGVTLSRRSARIASGVFGVLGLALFALGAGTVIYFATGSSLILSLTGHPLAGPPALSCEKLD